MSARQTRSVTDAYALLQRPSRALSEWQPRQRKTKAVRKQTARERSDVPRRALGSYSRRNSNQPLNPNDTDDTNADAADDDDDDHDRDASDPASKHCIFRRCILPTAGTCVYQDSHGIGLIVGEPVCVGGMSALFCGAALSVMLRCSVVLRSSCVVAVLYLSAE